MQHIVTDSQTDRQEDRQNRRRQADVERAIRFLSDTHLDRQPDRLVNRDRQTGTETGLQKHIDRRVEG